MSEMEEVSNEYNEGVDYHFDDVIEIDVEQTAS